MSKITYTDKEYIFENAEIPAKNKITDDDMNNIKNAINQIGAYISTTAGSNGDFYCTLTGTLSVGDIVKTAFPAATNRSSDARLSIDGASGTYYNIVNDTSNRLKAGGVENLNAVFRYNGVALEVKQIDQIVLTQTIAPNTQVILNSVIGKTEVFAYYTGAYNERCMIIYNRHLINNSVLFMTSMADGTNTKCFGLLVDFTTGVVRNDNLSSVAISKIVIR